ncbi:MAG: PIN domain protein [Ignavibacteria bacterium CG1_02_37_35]|nr:MAG: PIN domain protein [Ignavibacteria bacterium CG1_02_37_35]
MKLYLDNCSYNRPFDDQRAIKIKIETEAKLFIQERVKAGEHKIVWSYILDFENSANPFEIRREAISLWKDIAEVYVYENAEILTFAKDIARLTIKSKDALHIACAIYAKCDYFITTDDLVIKKMTNNDTIKVVNPFDFIKREVRDGN